MRAFEAWENTLPEDGLEGFHSLAKTIHNHYEDIFAYWDSPSRITNAYTEGLNGLTKVANRMGRGYSYEIIRAKMLYAKSTRGKLAAAFGLREKRAALRLSSMVRTFLLWLKSRSQAALTETGRNR